MLLRPQTDPDGAIVNVDASDGTLVSVMLEAGQAILHLHSEAHHPSTVRLRGVRSIRVVDMLDAGNIPASLFWWSGPQAEKQPEVRAMLDAGNVSHTVPEGCSVFALVSSVGAQVFAICEDMTIATEDALA